MSVTRRKDTGKWAVHVYDQRAQKKVYVGQAATEKTARRLEAKKDEEINGEGGTTQMWTVDRFAEHFLTAYHGENTTRPEKSTLYENRRRLKRFREEHGRKRMDAVDRETAFDWSVKWPHEAKVLGAMFAEAVDKHGLRANPFLGLGKKSRGRADITPLTEQEVETIAGVAERRGRPWDRDFAALLRFMAWTGVRPGEACGLEWPEVDFRRGVIYVEWARRNDGGRYQTKTKEHRVVVLAQPARDALAGLSRNRGHVFATPTGKPLRPNSLRNFWVPVRDTFTDGLPMDHWLARRLRHNPDDHLDPYELRHHFGSMLADRGLAARDISEQMGNSVRVCEETYIHAFQDRVQDRVRRALEQEPAHLSVVREKRQGSEAV